MTMTVFLFLFIVGCPERLFWFGKFNLSLDEFLTDPIVKIFQTIDNNEVLHGSHERSVPLGVVGRTETETMTVRTVFCKVLLKQNP